MITSRTMLTSSETASLYWLDRNSKHDHNTIRVGVGVFGGWEIKRSLPPSLSHSRSVVNK